MRSLFGELRERIAGKGVKIVFPEGNDDRVVRAAARLKFEGLVDPIILGKMEFSLSVIVGNQSEQDR